LRLQVQVTPHVDLDLCLCLGQFDASFDAS